MCCAEGSRSEVNSQDSSDSLETVPSQRSVVNAESVQAATAAQALELDEALLPSFTPKKMDSTCGVKRMVENSPANGATTCAICMEPCTSHRPHKICCLACGHIFGRSCIEQWLSTKAKAQKSCPMCKKICKPTDIRELYVTTLAVVENAVTQTELEQARKKAKQYEMKTLSLMIQCENLKRQLEIANARVCSSSSSTTGSSTIMRTSGTSPAHWNSTHSATTNITRDRVSRFLSQLVAGCRVMPCQMNLVGASPLLHVRFVEPTFRSFVWTFFNIAPPQSLLLLYMHKRLVVFFNEEIDSKFQKMTFCLLDFIPRGRNIHESRGGRG